MFLLLLFVSNNGTVKYRCQAVNKILNKVLTGTMCRQFLDYENLICYAGLT